MLCSTKPNSYKLTYFNLTGRGETIRLIFAAAGVKFEDNRIDGAAWAAMKPKTPFGGLPLLEVNGKVVLSQSMAIARYAARETGLAGKTSVDQALVDSIAETINELREKLISIIIGDPAQKEAGLAEFAKNGAPPLLEKINKFLASNNGGSGYLVGSTLTWADLHLFATIEIMKMAAPNSSAEIAKFPLIEQLFTRVGSLPRVAEYIKTRGQGQ